MKIVLIGFRGTGKTTIGKKLAKKLKYKYYSVDEEIKQKMNMSITEIVEQYGWKYFRKLESEIISSFVDYDRIILDTGGGSILYKKNRNYLKKNSYVIQFIASKKNIVERILKGNDRPKLTTLKTIDNEVSKLLKERKELYDSITNLKINTSRNDINSTLDKIIKKIKV